MACSARRVVVPRTHRGLPSEWFSNKCNCEVQNRIDTPGYSRGSLASPPLGDITAPNEADQQFTRRLRLSELLENSFIHG